MGRLSIVISRVGWGKRGENVLLIVQFKVNVERIESESGMSRRMENGRWKLKRMTE